MSCDSNNDVQLDEPATYEFTRNGESTVSFSGQTTRIKMGTELFEAMSAPEQTTEQDLLRMYRNLSEDGSDVDPFSEAALNESSKSIKSKVAASRDYFASNATLSAELKNDFETWMSGQVNEVFPNWNQQAEPGVPGQIVDGTSARYINAQGLEYNQMVAKGLIGALMVDQMLNNYLSTSVLDESTNREENTAGETAEGSNYTTMEHKWDEAYGYIYGTAADPATPNATIGEDDIFLNKYTARVANDEDFESIDEDIYNAFKKGRAAIVAGEYDIRDEQANIIREAVSNIIGIRAVYYLQAGKRQMEAGDLGAAFHSLSEGYGFIYSLQFTRVAGSDQPYLTSSEVQGLLTQLLSDGENGLWDVEPSTLDEISAQIAVKFEFTIQEAASN
ncbi:DUF4856 domain-containing protein [Gracilimonas mengyeensis]|uniref:DUF4856 domain-containing protein n=1 Tax=Gracilimonas mengyeensis TaxID=1302730 RepID=A0A521F5A0_9BACT|nr:DUF4856 domain-containing protein [Gracilimonas mengyeensis]SMO90821.1 protein of unknown function [Gracilimonas mengyeensis]